MYSFLLRKYNYEIHFLYSPTTRTDPVPTRTESSIPIPSQVEFWKSGLPAASRCRSAQFLKEPFWGQEVGLEKNSYKKYPFSLSVKLWELLDCVSWLQLLFYSLCKVTCIKTTNDSRVQNQPLKLHMQISWKLLQITKLGCNVFPVGIATMSSLQCSVRCGMQKAECTQWLCSCQARLYM